MNELEIIEDTNIESMIYEIRGVQIMLDSDLAELYECTNGTKDINKAVKRNLNRFPDDFYFQLSDEECSRFQIGTLNKKRGENIKYLPHVFTEQGVAMLASVLHTEIAEQTSVKIMRTFVKMRKYLSLPTTEQTYYKNMLLNHDKKLNTLEKSLNKLNEKQKINSIFFKGQMFDAYVLFMKICKSAKKNIIIIDDYACLELFNLLKDINKEIIVYSSNIKEEHLKKYKEQYNNIEVINCDLFHDRFIIIDRKYLYHSGASFKDLGKKCFAINKIEDKEILNRILTELEK